MARSLSLEFLEGPYQRLHGHAALPALVRARPVSHLHVHQAKLDLALKLFVALEDLVAPGLTQMVGVDGGEGEGEREGERERERESEKKREIE